MNISKMKTIGIIGGMTCESTHEYYRLINKYVREKLGGNHSAEIILYSVDFSPVQDLMERGKWDDVSDILTDRSKKVEYAGADFLIISTNTMHKLADEIQKHIDIRILNLIDAVACEIKKKNLKKVGLLGTRFTMKEDFYKTRLEKKHGIEVCVPATDDIELIHRIIMDELSIGVIKDSSAEKYWSVINNMKAEHEAQGFILGCTEIPLLINESQGDVPLFDTTDIHARAAADFALK